MKKLIRFYALLAITCPSSIFAQNVSPENLAPMKKWKVSQFDFGLGINNDKYNSMSYNDILAFAKNPYEMQKDLSEFEEEVNTFTAGVSLYGNISISPLNLSTESYRNDREIRLGFGAHAPKEAMVSFKSEDLDSSIVFCNLHGEFTLEAAYIYKGLWGKRFNWYIGYGVNVGATFANEMILISGKYFKPEEHPSTQEYEDPNQESFTAKSVFYSRAYIPYGLHYSLNKNWLLGLDFKTGIGVQKIAGEELNFIKKTGAFVLGAKYRLN